MKTDPSIYEFLATDAEAFRVLSGGVILNGAYRFSSLTIKGIERRLDGIYEPEGHDGPVYACDAGMDAGVLADRAVSLTQQRGVTNHVERF